MREIVGVARQVKGRPDETEDRVHVYVPLAQDPVDDIFMLVRAGIGTARGARPGGPRGHRPGRQGAAGQRQGRHDARRRGPGGHGAPPVPGRAGDDVRRRWRFSWRWWACSAILAYSVQQRVRELGVRRALGATTRDVLRLVVGHAVRVIATGAVIGLALSAAFSRVLSTMLYGVQPLDPATFAFVTDRARGDRCRRHLRPGLAGHPRRSGGRPARRVTTSTRDPAPTARRSAAGGGEPLLEIAREDRRRGLHAAFPGDPVRCRGAVPHRLRRVERVERVAERGRQVESSGHLPARTRSADRRWRRRRPLRCGAAGCA